MATSIDGPSPIYLFISEPHAQHSKEKLRADNHSLG
jgi:hypothetical protein